MAKISNYLTIEVVCMEHIDMEIKLLKVLKVLELSKHAQMI